jgi:UDP-N-acetylmuramate dehydrogenase
MKKQTIEKMDGIRGALTANAPLGAESWFECGGTADLLFQPADLEDLKLFLNQYYHPERSEGSPEITILGGMANTIIRDGGVRGVVIRLGKPFSEVKVEGTKIYAGAGALNGSVAAAAVKAGIGGLEFLSGVPGTVGGALRMNAGAYGSEVKDILLEVKALDHRGILSTFTPSSRRKPGSTDRELVMSYRHTDLPEGMIVTNVTFEGKPEDPEIVRARLKDIKAKRQDTQPIAERTGGSTFANPSGMKAWELIDKVGGRGFKIGGAQMSEKHCNFMINTGNATATDLENLGDEMIRRVNDQFGIELKWEIKRIGEK